MAISLRFPPARRSGIPPTVARTERPLVVVAINVSGNQQALQTKVPGQPVAIYAYQTDRSKNCERVEHQSPIPPKAIRTVVFKY